MSALELFQTLRGDLPKPALDRLRADVREHYEQLLRAQKRNELVAIDLAELLCVRLEELLVMAHVIQPNHRADIVGAARYFISTADTVPDDLACTGLDDDVEVFNHVVRLLDRSDLLISE